MKLLALVVEAGTVRACLDAAITAARVDPFATIEALHVVVDPERLVTSSEEVQIQRLRERTEGSARQRADAAQAAFVAWTAGTGDATPKVNWKSVTGAEEDMVIQEAEDADLIILARGHDLDSSDAQHAALLATGKPVLLVPGNWSARGLSFSHMAVALSDTPVTDDAIRGAMPWLRAAERVTALRIGDEKDRALTLADRLREEGVPNELRVVAPKGSDRGVQIVEEARAIGADVLIAGAYRHSRLVEWLMGGTTRHMLAAADLPLLLAH